LTQQNSSDAAVAAAARRETVKTHREAKPEPEPEQDLQLEPQIVIERTPIEEGIDTSIGE
jgi:hypothetical protein